MTRKKKNGEFLSFYMDKSVSDRLRNFAAENGLTLTSAVEIILRKFFEEHAVEPETHHDMHMTI